MEQSVNVRPPPRLPIFLFYLVWYGSRNYMTLFFFVVEINRKSNNCISNNLNMSSMDSIKFYISDTGQVVEICWLTL